MYLLVVLSLVNGISFTLEGKGALRCFSQYVNTGKELSGAYVVSGEKDQNVLTTVVDPNGRIVHTSQARSREGKFEIKADKDSVYKLCFQSKDKTPKSISFDVYSQEGLQEENFATQDEITPLRTTFRRVSRNLDTVYRNIQFYERRERTHRDLAEVTCDRVLFCGIIKMVVLALISFAQIWIMRTLFNNKRGVTV
ncbi:hypothetical protein SteCoe_25023 [Stentor coeruleus]|uniref:GOLD domain-containing protein n=1 Tax=Stentor coeruleus TaxID=5963 RepID=A0A1R2BG94_9CILI|nr:hypothetical protein SteCoe_25023 [Stentor coeruleus]